MFERFFKKKIEIILSVLYNRITWKQQQPHLYAAGQTMISIIPHNISIL